MTWQETMTAVSRRRPEVEIRLERLEELADPAQRSCGIAMIRIADQALRGQGLAGAALRELCEAADRLKVQLHLTPGPLPRSHGLSTARLRAWFGSRGFRPNTGRKSDQRVNGDLIRRPRS